MFLLLGHLLEQLLDLAVLSLELCLETCKTGEDLALCLQPPLTHSPFHLFTRWYFEAPPRPIPVHANALSVGETQKESKEPAS